MPDPEKPPPPSRIGRLRVVDLHDPAGVLARVEDRPEALRACFAPIADLGRGTIAGYEVLVAIDREAAVAPAVWSEEVHPDAAGRLEAVLAQRALAERAEVPDGAFLMVGVSTAALRSSELPAVI